MMLGPTGTGKSEMLKTFAEACDCPVVFVSTSEIRPMGWRGMHITDLIARKINDGVPIEKMQYAIIVLDEIDKITRYGARILSDAGNDDTHDLMRDIMKLLDVGHKLTIDNGVNTLEGTQSVIELPTDNLLLVFSGAFSGIEDIIKRRMNIHSTIGYSSANQSVDAEDKYMKHVTTEDLEKWGYLPELLGRIGVYAVMNPLSVETMIEIMKQAKGSILEGHVDYAMRNHIDLRFSDEALRIIAEKAYESGLGFRNVRSLLANLLNKLYFDMSTSDASNDTQVVTVDVEFISKHLRIR
jgi:ATP-dependent Clp protease ATP-binding subunit ClpX